MKVILNPDRKDWKKLTIRPVTDQKELSVLVNRVFSSIRKQGDKAVNRYSMTFDGALQKSLSVSSSEIEMASDKIPENLKNAIKLAKRNITRFHFRGKQARKIIETSKGVKCWYETRPIEKVGIYIPGGTAPLFSTVLMLGIPAKLAGCREIVMCTPPGKNGKIDPAILYTAALCGINKIFAIGGIQAIGAMTFGTKSVPAVDKILGPGNRYVTAAKQAAQNFGVAIDMPAGPSELIVIADDGSNPVYVAADLLSQAEHDSDSQVFLLTDNINLVKNVKKELSRQLEALPRRDIAENALESSKAVVLESICECVDFSNLYAPEHLILVVEDYEKYIPAIKSAGSVFLGKYSCESAGDYASGTNHTLPTNGCARNYSGVSLDSFVKKITFQQLNETGMKNIGPAVQIMAEAEQLAAHRNAVTVRLNDICMKKK
ncbi:MAG: histidinol dehydrogenase [Bacteroidota bacterium]